MKVIIIPQDIHPAEGHPGVHHYDGEPYEGTSLEVTAFTVRLDGDVVLTRDDKRPLEQRVLGHPWLEPGTGSTWTGFTVQVIP